jgi:Ca2+-binding RTX toxin-like protein
MRFINFTMPGQPALRIRLQEQADGSILATLELEGDPVADIRAVFFDLRDAALIPHLSVAGPDVTDSRFADGSVIDLGQGANVRGVLDPFDAGVEFGTPGQGRDLVRTTSFVLSSAVGGLTLDDLALVRFGLRLQSSDTASKSEVLAPAAPNAIDDSLTAVEDIQIVFPVLDNDTDEDGRDDFRIVAVTDPEHGTATISEDGKTIVYLADHNYSGPDSFTYDMIDGHGGGDTAVATINVIAVADAPTLELSIAPGADVNEMLLTVTAQVTDTDGSEYIDRFVFASLPAGAEIVGGLLYDPSTTGQLLTHTFAIKLAPNSDFNFDIAVTAIAKELSNGHEEGTLATENILVDSNVNSFSRTFLATDQSMWAGGDAFILKDDRFLGIDFDPPAKSTGDFVEVSADFRMKAGFQSTLDINGGKVDAEVPYDISISTTYNHATDVLLIQSLATLDSNGVSFTTDSPRGKYLLEFILNWSLSASIHLDGFGTLWSPSFGNDESKDIISFDTDGLQHEEDLGLGFSLNFAWPHIDTTSEASSTNRFVSSGESENFLALVLDVDQLFAELFLEGENPFDFSFDWGFAWGSFEALDIDLEAGLNLIQDFLMSVDSLTGWLVFEDGTRQAWDFSDVLITGASAHDADGDGIVEFDLELAPNVKLTNDIDIGVKVGYNIDILKGSGEYGLDLGPLDVIVDTTGDWRLPTVWNFSDSATLTSFGLYETTFDLRFESQTISFAGNQSAIAAPAAAVSAAGVPPPVQGTAGNDMLDLSAGGAGTALGGAGNDVLYFGGAFTGAGVADGGEGRDAIVLQGAYVVTLGEASLAGIESISLQSGANARWGDTAGNFYDFDLTMADGNVAAGQQLIVNGQSLRPGEDFTFDGSAERDGKFLIYGGHGVDTLRGGAGNDVFFFEGRRWGAGDRVDGGGGRDSVVLSSGSGINRFEFADGSFAGIESISLNNRFATDPGQKPSYELVLANGNVAPGGNLIVNGSSLADPAQFLSVDGSGVRGGSLTLLGGAGNDTLKGGEGGDLLFAGGGRDRLAGGGGGDTFQFRATSDSAAGARDIILDFESGLDRIDLSRIDADSHAAGDQAFRWIGAAAFAGAGAASAGELRAYERDGAWIVEGDVDGDGIADLVVEIVLHGPMPPAPGDFLL